VASPFETREDALLRVRVYILTSPLRSQ
jgi:hypothetical protein